jgi:hypothetical protein
MIDDQIDHQLQARLMGLGRHSAHLLFRRRWVRPVEQSRVEPKIIGDGIEAARSTRLLDRVDENPIEMHPGGTLEVLVPAGERACQQRKKII